MTALMGIDARLKLARLYLCTDARQEQGDLPDFLEAVLQGGVDLVQIRQKGMDKAAELDVLALARRIAMPYQGLVVVNDSPAVAGEFRADVLHLGQDDEKPKRARKSLHEWAKIGMSTHDPKQLKAAIADRDVDYFCVGPVWQTPTKPDYTPAGLDLVRAAAAAAPPSDPGAKPWFAIGGIADDTIDQVIEAGARRVVVVRAICDAPDPEAAARRLKDRLRQAWRDDPAMEAYSIRAVQ
ncbi:thiamine phosphate synthase [Propionibacteriaceae bacterium Y2011]